MNMKLINDDCMKVLPAIADQSIGLVLCDLPYDCDKTRAKWDKSLDLDAIFAQYRRIIKPNGAILLFGNEPFSSRLRVQNLDIYKYDIKCVKNIQTGFANANYRPMNNYDDILVFSYANASTGGKANPMVYNPQGLIPVNVTRKNRANRHGLVMAETNNTGENNSLLQEGSEYVQKFTNYPKNVIYFDVEHERFHPTQKPVALLEYLIKTYSNDGDIVLDNCMGSGSTGIAAAKTGREFVGIELDEKYFQIASERIGAT